MILISRGTVRYRRTALDFQSPKILMISRGKPAWKANEAPSLKGMGAKIHSMKATFCEACTQFSHEKSIGERPNIKRGMYPLEGI